eukprot:TRINITY_DN44196_c0_g1_i1.p1 TRINITY_DN44196_c0_g1~~TRINITY_DN44196_c0_g1_i1.p1  ORF type:complete len:374 (+),score=64.13 TRINITY_DN44196_c0_g1_i1:64-1185(+)
MSDEGKRRMPSCSLGWRPDHADEYLAVRGWIDIPICEGVLAEPLKFLCCVDGSKPSLTALDWLCDDVLQRDRQAFVEVLHLYDESKDVPLARRKDTLYDNCQNKLASSASSKRYNLAWKDRKGMTGVDVADMILDHAVETQPSFMCVGIYGVEDTRKQTFTNHVLEMLRFARSSVIVFKDEDSKLLPIRRKAVFAVSVSLNQASTKAFLDALKLSKPGDEIHVVYIKSYMEDTDDSDYTTQLKEKYASFFGDIKGDAASGVFKNFNSRDLTFAAVPKQKHQTIPQAMVQYADEVDADFIVIGTNSLRVERGKPVLGTVSLQIMQETARNVLVSFWLDISPKLFGDHVKTSRPPSRSSIRPPSHSSVNSSKDKA